MPQLAMSCPPMPGRRPSAALPDVAIFHAGTRLENGRAVTAGGRVLCVCALGDSVADAQRRAYAEVAGISWPGEFHRHDIGWRAILRENAAG